MSGYVAAVGDLVDAEYVANAHGTVARLRGVVGGVAEFNGQQTTSVYGDGDGDGDSTMSSTMPVHLVAEAGTREARDAVWQLLRSGRKLPERVAARLTDALEAVAFSLDEPPLGPSHDVASAAPVAPARRMLDGIDWTGLAAEARGQVALVDVEAGEGERQEWGRRG
jgi:hypothetical protein